MRNSFAKVAIVPFATILLFGAAHAQETTSEGLTIGDQTVPSEQITAVEDWCKELQAQQGLTGTQEPETTMTEEQADAATASTGDAAETFDVSTVTLEMCQEAGLTDSDGD